MVKQSFMDAWRELRDLNDATKECQEGWARMVVLLTHAKLTKSYRSVSCPSISNFSAFLGLSRRDFNDFLRTGMVYVHRLGLTNGELAALGAGKSRLLRTSIQQLLAEGNREAALQLIEHARNVPIGDLESRFAIHSLVNEAREGNLKEVDKTIDPMTVANDRVQSHRQVLIGLVSQILRGPTTRFPPPPDDFVVSQENWHQLTLAVAMPCTALLVGPAGTGKTELVEHLGRATGRKLHVFSFGAMSEPRMSLIGQTHFNPTQGTVFSASRFCTAIQEVNAIVLLDELNRADDATLNMLIPLLDGQRVLALDECQGAPLIRVGEGTTFVATANVGGEYTGTQAIDGAIRDRFSTICTIAFPTIDEEANLMRSRFRSLGSEQALSLAKIAAQQRRLAREGEFDINISTRMLLETAKKISYFVSMEHAVEFSMTNHFSDEGGNLSDRCRFKQLIAGYDLT